MAFWHPFADMAAVSQQELVIERGEGVWVFDTAGKRYFDATASLWYANIGHGRDGGRRRGRRAAAHARGLPHVRRHRGTSRPTDAVRAARRRTRRCPDAKIFLTSGGGDSIEVAAKLARRHFVQHGQPERVHLISRTQGYHGTHGFGTSLGGIEANVTNWGPLMAQVTHRPARLARRRWRPRSARSARTRSPRSSASR